MKHASDKGLVSKIGKKKKALKLSSRKTNNPISKWAKDPNRRFTTEDPQFANDHMRRCSTSYVIGKMQTKMTTRHHYRPLRTAQSRTPATPSAGETGRQERSARRVQRGAATVQDGLAASCGTQATPTP